MAKKRRAAAKKKNKSHKGIIALAFLAAMLAFIISGCITGVTKTGKAYFTGSLTISEVFQDIVLHPSSYHIVIPDNAHQSNELVQAIASLNSALGITNPIIYESDTGSYLGRNIVHLTADRTKYDTEGSQMAAYEEGARTILYIVSGTLESLAAAVDVFAYEMEYIDFSCAELDEYGDVQRCPVVIAVPSSGESFITLDNQRLTIIDTYGEATWENRLTGTLHLFPEMFFITPYLDFYVHPGNDVLDGPVVVTFNEVWDTGLLAYPIDEMYHDRVIASPGADFEVLSMTPAAGYYETPLVIWFSYI